MRSLHADAAHGLAHVEEEIHRKVVFLRLQPAELAHLRQPFVHLRAVCGKGYLIYLFLAQRAQATFPQQPSYFVETKLAFEVIRINHAAKLLIFYRISKKVALKFAGFQKNLYLCTRFRDIRALERW